MSRIANWQTPLNKPLQFSYVRRTLRRQAGYKLVFRGREGESVPPCGSKAWCSAGLTAAPLKRWRLGEGGRACVVVVDPRLLLAIQHSCCVSVQRKSFVSSQVSEKDSSPAKTNLAKRHGSPRVPTPGPVGCEWGKCYKWYVDEI